jgi:S-DNA-T family DNA segregation ATPase FtsK/SpoIIIE
MAKTVKSTENKSTATTSWRFTRQHRVLLGIMMVLFAVALLVAFVSFFMHGNQDQSTLNTLTERGDKA